MRSFWIVSLALLQATGFAQVAKVVSIDDSFARAAISAQRNSAVFMNITNRGPAAAVVRASSPVADVVELHTHVDDQGLMRMRKIERIDLPSNQAVALQPGGLHVMLLGLTSDLRSGDQIDVTLEFDDGSERSLQVPVRPMQMKHGKGVNKAPGKPMQPRLMVH